MYLNLLALIEAFGFKLSCLTVVNSSYLKEYWLLDYLRNCF